MDFTNAKLKIRGNIGSVDVNEANGNKVARVRVAADVGYKSDGEYIEQVEWFDVVFFGGVADIVDRNAEKGDMLVATCTPSTDEYEVDGETRQSREWRYDYDEFAIYKDQGKPATPEQQLDAESGKSNSRRGGGGGSGGSGGDGLPF